MGGVKRKGISMRKSFILAATIILAGAVAAHAQDSTTPQTSSSQPPVDAPDAATPTIQRVKVVDVSELPQETQDQVDQLVAQTSTDNLKQLQTSIDATPEAKAALEAKGASSSQVVATSMDTDGTLTLITKKNS